MSSSATAASETAATPAAASEWSKVFSHTHQAYYWFNASTGESSWTEPEGSATAAPGGGRGSDSTDQRTSAGKIDGQAASAAGAASSREEEEPSTKRRKVAESDGSSSTGASTSTTARTGHKIAIIVPFRDLHVEQKRSEHLRAFVPAMTRFLSMSNQPFVIYIVEQSDDGRKFNRGQLLNIGFDIARKEMCDIFIFHDVDLIPSEDLLSAYTTLPVGMNPMHVAKVWDRYNVDPNYFGGIVAYSKEQFEMINGFPNNFWGWGGEDNELHLRSKEVGLKSIAPTKGTITDLEEMNLDQKLDFLRAHKEWKCLDKWERLETHNATWRTNGLKDLNYVVNKDEFINGQESARMIRVTLSD